MGPMKRTGELGVSQVNPVSHEPRHEGSQVKGLASREQRASLVQLDFIWQMGGQIQGV